MLMHPTRTNLLLLREKVRSVTNSVGILKARRQALIRELLTATVPFLRSRQEIRRTYAQALAELALSRGQEGETAMASLAARTGRDFRVTITEKSVWGLAYRDLAYEETPVRSPEERGYDWRSTTPHVEEAITLFEKVLDAMLQLAEYESKIKRLGDEVLRTTRRIRVLEERVVPELRVQIRAIALSIGERDREAYYRLKRFKEA